MKKTLFLWALLAAPFFGIAQEWADYNSFYSKGDIPSDFTDDFIEKYEKMRERISQDATQKAQSDEESFYRRTEYYINDFLVSGDVVFGDTISQYCSELLDRILVSNPELRKKLRVYTVKSPEFNAYATESGIIFVNVGLLAEIENEAQLAFILAHEVIHFEESHVLEEFVEKTKLDRNKGLYKQEDLDSRLRLLSSYSKSQELEADRYGFERYYSHLGYESNEAVYLMDVMQYSYLPFDDVAFSYDFIETPNFNIPDKYKLDVINEIVFDDDRDDSMSSHPNIKTRRDSIQLVSDNKKGSQYLVSESWFNYCQRLARYEGCRMHLVRQEFPEAIYSAFLLSEKYGVDKFQKKIVAKALQASSGYKNDNNLKEVTRDEEDVEGESQQVFFLWNKIKKRELNTLAVSYSYGLHQEYPDDKDIYQVYRHALSDLVIENRLDMDDYRLKPYRTKVTVVVDTVAVETAVVDTLDAVTEDDIVESRSRNSKLTRIREKQTVEYTEVADSIDVEQYNFKPEKYYLAAFLHLQNDSTFLSDFEALENRQQNGNSTSTVSTSRYINGMSRFGDGSALGIDTLLMVNSLYLNLDEQEETGVRFVKSFDRQDNYNQLIDDLALKVGIDVTRLDFKSLGVSEVDVYNDLCVLNNWLEERIEHGNTGARMSNYDEINRVREKYGINYVGYNGNISIRVRDPNHTTRIIATVLFPVILPFTISKLLKPQYESYNFFYVFDLSSGAALMAEYNYYNNSDKDAFLKSISYYNLLQVSTKAAEL